MFGKNPRLNPLVSRKQLLIAESELNRAQLVEEWQTMTDGVRSVAKRTRTISFIASAAASLIAGLGSFRHARFAPADEKPSWWQTLLRGVRLAGSLWSEFRPQGRNQKDKL
jgi:hypothetical protein